MTQKVRIAVVGLGFGSEFIPIYQAHPDSELVAVCQRSENSVNEVADHFGVDGRYTSYDELLEDPDIDAVHINTPIPNHAEQSIAALRAGKHVACTVPMATSVDDCRRIVQATEASGRNYMMMETVVFTRELLHIKSFLSTGTLGKLQYVRGAHYQNMRGWPGYWEGLPPMYYATHAVSPALSLIGSRAESVICVGSGTIAPELARVYNSPFAVETALVSAEDSDVRAEISRSLFDTSHEYVESFDVFASDASFRWAATESSRHQLHVSDVPQQVEIPDYASLLPEEIRSFTTKGVFDAEHEHLSFTQGSGHGGSHPHLANEFIASIVENRRPSIDHHTAANWTMTGLLAHESALRGGDRVWIPRF